MPLCTSTKLRAVRIDQAGSGRMKLNRVFSVFGFGSPQGHELIISRLRLKSLEDTVVYA